MSANPQTTSPSKSALWFGRILSMLIILFMLMDASMKLVEPQFVIDGTTKYGYSQSVIHPLGVVSLASTLLYAFPQTAVLGAILLTGYFGGAIATHVRAGEPSFWVASLFGVITWLALYLREPRLRRLLPIRTG